MALLPHTTCPHCNGPVTFFEVMSVLTPFQAIDCSTCGELIFLKHKVELFLLSIGLALMVLVASVWALLLDALSAILVYSTGAAFLLGVEFLITATIILKKDLVVRRNK
ncbi:MAG: hypothetical protein IPN90_04400 [Elusimicrobia bacterium]|nr:hypothetical protein [Elusimicrobiota bacterium]